MRNLLIKGNWFERKQLNMYNFAEMEGMECCLWPNRYPLVRDGT